MTVDEFIQAIEENYLEKALKELSAEKIIVVYLSAKEYQRAKLTRSNYIPEDEEDEKSIEITIKNAD